MHAGMGKSGSSSIQHFLGNNAEQLLERGVCPVVASKGVSGGIQVERAGPKHAESNTAVGPIMNRPGEALPSLVSQCLDLMGDAECAVVSSEYMSQLVLNRREDFLTTLNKAAQNIDVTIAIYLRRQDRFLEAAWCQWGFRRDKSMSPSEYFLSLRPQLYYAKAYEAVKALAPEVRPDFFTFERSCFPGGDVVRHFAQEVLGVTGLAFEDYRKNISLPLSVANLLRNFPEGRYWSRDNDPRLMWKIKEWTSRIPTVDDSVDEKSRKLLSAICSHWYAKENGRLKSAIGASEEFCFSRPATGEEPVDLLHEIDTLWSKQLPSNQLEFVGGLLDFLLENFKLSRKS